MIDRFICIGLELPVSITTIEKTFSAIIFFLKIKWNIIPKAWKISTKSAKKSTEKVSSYIAITKRWPIAETPLQIDAQTR